MSGQTPEQEPSIEEILASIRQIISDDDEGTSDMDVEPESEPHTDPMPDPVPAPVEAAKPAPEEKPVPKAAPKKDDDILELNDPLPPPSPRPVIDLEDALEEEDEKEFFASLDDDADDRTDFGADAVVEEPVMEKAPDPVPAYTDPVPAPATAAPAKTEPRPDFGVSEDSILGEAARMAALSGFSKLANNMPLERGTTPQRSPDGTTLEDILRDMLNPMLREWLDANLPVIIEKLVQKELDKLARRASDD